MNYISLVLFYIFSAVYKQIVKMTVRKLSPALQKRAQKEINEDPKRIPEDISALRDWLRMQPHLELIQPSK